MPLGTEVLEARLSSPSQRTPLFPTYGHSRFTGTGACLLCLRSIGHTNHKAERGQP